MNERIKKVKRKACFEEFAGQQGALGKSWEREWASYMYGSDG
jgi:hypothetical protein